MGLGNILKDLKDDLFTYRTVKVRGRGRTFRGLSLSLSLFLSGDSISPKTWTARACCLLVFLDGTVSNGRGEVLFVLSRLCASIRRDLSLSLSLSLGVKC